MKFEIKHTCGHSKKHELTGPWKGREKREAWLKSKPCVDCWKKGQEFSAPAIAIANAPTEEKAQAIADAIKQEEKAPKASILKQMKNGAYLVKFVIAGTTLVRFVSAIVVAGWVA